MSRDDKQDNTINKMVVNHDEQSSIWFSDRENPVGWRDAGKSGNKAECLALVAGNRSKQASSLNQDFHVLCSWECQTYHVNDNYAPFI